MSPPTDEEPDYRFTLANERTFLAWLRTALALLAAGVAVVQLVPEFGITGARETLGVALAALSVLAAMTSVRRWERVERAMRRREALPVSRSPLILAVGLVVVSLAVLILLALPSSR